MKETTLVKLLVGAAYAIALSVAIAQESSTTTTSTSGATGTTSESTTTTTSSAGTITAYTPGSDYITFRTTTDAAPVKYYYTKETSILDPAGRTVTWSDIRPDLPATVYYVREGDRMIVRKIVLTQPVRKIEKETTTTTTTQP
jgi:hypothetical protein